MIEIDIPDFGQLRLAHLVLDYNGTLAFDGKLLSGVADLLERLAEHLRIHIITADTFGSVHQAFAGSDFTIHVLPPGNEEESKVEYVQAAGKHVIGLHRQWPQRPADAGRGRVGNCCASAGGHGNTGASCRGYHHSEHCRCLGSPPPSKAYYRHPALLIFARLFLLFFKPSVGKAKTGSFCPRESNCAQEAPPHRLDSACNGASAAGTFQRHAARRR